VLKCLLQNEQGLNSRHHIMKSHSVLNSDPSVCSSSLSCKWNISYSTESYNFSQSSLICSQFVGHGRSVYVGKVKSQQEVPASTFSSFFSDLRTLLPWSHCRYLTKRSSIKILSFTHHISFQGIYYSFIITSCFIQLKLTGSEWQPKPDKWLCPLLPDMDNISLLPIYHAAQSIMGRISV